MPYTTRLDVALVQMLMIVAIGGMFYVLLAACGLKHLANIMKLVTALTGVSAVVGAVWDMISRAAEWLQGVADKLDRVLFFIK